MPATERKNMPEAPNYLLDMNFYAIDAVSLNEAGNHITATFTINPGHPVFAAHFPGFPVTPGMCICQMNMEVLQIALGKKQRLKEAKNIKFLEIINPETVHSLQMDIHLETGDHEVISSKTVISGNGKVYSKLHLYTF